MDWATAMLKIEFWFENWQLCSSRTIQILESREKNMKLGTKKGNIYGKKAYQKKGGQVAVWFTLHTPF